MKYEIKEVRATKKKVEIEVSAEDFNNYYSQTLKKISADAEIPGFRKGKAPEDMVESRVTKEGVLSEAAEIAIRESWAKFLAESKEEADRLFSELSVGGNVEGSMGESPWGTYMGMFRDKYGIEWIIEFSPER